MSAEEAETVAVRTASLTQLLAELDIIPIHSAIGCVCPEDLAGAVDLISAFAEEFKEPL